VLVDEWGAWVSGIAPLHDAGGAIGRRRHADLPADVAIRLEGLRGNLSETFASLVHSAAVALQPRRGRRHHRRPHGAFHNHRHLHELWPKSRERRRTAERAHVAVLSTLTTSSSSTTASATAPADAALRGVAQIIESSIRHVDLAARYGGEEFAVILVDTGARAGMRVAERIRRRVARDHHGAAAG